MGRNVMGERMKGEMGQRMRGREGGKKETGERRA